MVGDLWGKAPAQLGAYPHLPITPADTPENFIFLGTPLWEAICTVADYLGLTVSGNYPGPTITVCGAADATYTALANRYGAYLEDSMEYIDTGSGRVPSQVVVYFHRRNQYCGTEETVRRDAPQWQNTSLYSVTIAAPSTFTGAAGTAYLWADYTVRYDMDGNPLASDVATAATIAAERATQYFNKIHRGTQGFARTVYAGALPFTTGSLVDGVRWSNTGMLGTREDSYAGWRTEVLCGYVWPEVTFPLNLKGLTGPD